jgi:hypothetical protein
METSAPTSFQLAFRPPCNDGRGYAFPCDEEGHVDLNRMSDRVRNDYLYARAMVGRFFCPPAVETLAA